MAQRRSGTLCAEWQPEGPLRPLPGVGRALGRPAPRHDSLFGIAVEPGFCLPEPLFNDT